MEVQVALLGQPFGAFNVPATHLEKSEWDVPWTDRPKVTVSVASSTTLADVLDEAAKLLGVAATSTEGAPLRVSDSVAGVAFYVDEPNEGRWMDRRIYPTIGTDGVVRWDEDARRIPMERLADAHSEGVLVGDPSRVYLIPQSSAGAFGPAEWKAILHALEVTDNVLNHLGGDVAGLGVIGTAGALAWKRGRQAIVSVWKGWADRGGGIEDVSEAVRGTSWAAADAGRRLGCTAEQATSILGMLGLAPSPEGAWRFTESPQAAALRKLVTAATVIQSANLAPERQQAVIQLIAGALANGEDLDDEEIRTIVWKQVNPHYGEWDKGEAP